MMTYESYHEFLLNHAANAPVNYSDELVRTDFRAEEKERIGRDMLGAWSVNHKETNRRICWVVLTGAGMYRLATGAEAQLFLERSYEIAWLWSEEARRTHEAMIERCRP